MSSSSFCDVAIAWIQHTLARSTRFKRPYAHPKYVLLLFLPAQNPALYVLLLVRLQNLLRNGLPSKSAALEWPRGFTLDTFAHEGAAPAARDHPPSRNPRSHTAIPSRNTARVGFPSPASTSSNLEMLKPSETASLRLSAARTASETAAPTYFLRSRD